MYHNLISFEKAGEKGFLSLLNVLYYYNQVDRGECMMIRFNCDYLEGTHPRILQVLTETNMEQTIGYGEDDYCQQAREKIKEVCKCELAAVHFLVGGTQANLTVISSILRPHQAVLCVKEGHINVHETGSIAVTK